MPWHLVSPGYEAGVTRGVQTQVTTSDIFREIPGILQAIHNHLVTGCTVTLFLHTEWLSGFICGIFHVILTIYCLLSPNTTCLFTPLPMPTRSVPRAWETKTLLKYECLYRSTWLWTYLINAWPHEYAPLFSVRPISKYLVVTKTWKY